MVDSPEASAPARRAEPSAPHRDTINNFDLLRLLAALQVVYFHAKHHLGITLGGAGEALSKVGQLFPGVPIFFVISGFLISRSYERSSSLHAYARNRFLRIYPALWVSFAVSLALLAALGALDTGFVATPAFLAWVVAQLSVGQSYHPSQLRSFGVGVLNGSLWTIPVELGFYVLLPLVYVPLRRMRRAAGDLLLLGIAAASYTIAHAASASAAHAPRPLLKLLLFSPLPYFYMFLFGVLLHRNFERLRRLFEGRVLFWTAGYIGLMLAADAAFGRPAREAGYAPALVADLALAGWTLSFAFSRRTLSERLLRGNDISYGVYIYHMLIVNVFVHHGLTGQLRYLFGAAALAIVVAALSWRFVEAPALKRKAVRVPTAIPQAAAKLT